MKKKELSIKEWMANFLTGKYDAPDTETQCDAGWYDWFCSDKALQRKTEKLGRKLLQIVKSSKIDVENNYVFFKNNCPCFGSLYDDFRICDIKTGDVLYTIVPSSGHKISKGEASVWGHENEFKEPLVIGTWRDVLAFFLQGIARRADKEKQKEAV